MNKEQAMGALRQATRQSAKQLLTSYKLIFPESTVGQLTKLVLKSKNPNLPRTYKAAHSWITRQLKTAPNATKKRKKLCTVATPAVTRAIVKEMHLKEKTSIRKIAAKLTNSGNTISMSTVARVGKKMGLKPYKKYRQQDIKYKNKQKRVETAKLWLNRYGVSPKNRKFIWHKVICTDFSAYMRIFMQHNRKNSIIYAKSRREIDESGLGVARVSKYSPGVMLWGAICSEGLLPKKKPIFFNDYLKTYCERVKKEKKTMDSLCYQSFLSEIVFPMLKKELGQDVFENYIWQDDPDTKHRTLGALKLISNTFKQRIDTNEQSAKMADIWPIENIWGIIRGKLEGLEYEDEFELRKAICREWRQIDFEICNSAMLSIPRRLQAVINKKGEQVSKSDYS